MDPDQDQQSVSPDQGPNCLHRFSADTTNVTTSKEILQGGLSFVFLAASWSPAGERAALGSRVYVLVFVTFPYKVPGQVWYLIVAIPDLCQLYFECLTCERPNEYTKYGTCAIFTAVIFCIFSASVIRKR